LVSSQKTRDKDKDKDKGKEGDAKVSRGSSVKDKDIPKKDVAATSSPLPRKDKKEDVTSSSKGVKSDTTSPDKSRSSKVPRSSTVREHTEKTKDEKPKAESPRKSVVKPEVKAESPRVKVEDIPVSKRSKPEAKDHTSPRLSIKKDEPKKTSSTKKDELSSQPGTKAKALPSVPKAHHNEPSTPAYEPDKGPRAIAVDFTKVDAEVAVSKTDVVDPAVDSLVLDSVTSNFLRERYEPPNKYINLFREITLDKSEQLALSMVDPDSLTRQVADLHGPSNKMSASPFTERGLGQYFGEEDMGVLVMAPPHVSLQGLLDEDATNINFLGSMKVAPDAAVLKPYAKLPRVSDEVKKSNSSVKTSTSSVKESTSSSRPKELPKAPTEKKESASPPPVRAASAAEPLIWTDSKGTIGMTKRVWYQVLGKMDDGVLSDDTVAFIKTVGKLTSTSLTAEESDRAALGARLIEAMDKENPIDPRLLTRLVEQAESVKQ
jgi:hypothetical protein